MSLPMTHNMITSSRIEQKIDELRRTKGDIIDTVALVEVMDLRWTERVIKRFQEGMEAGHPVSLDCPEDCPGVSNDHENGEPWHIDFLDIFVLRALKLHLEIIVETNLASTFRISEDRTFIDRGVEVFGWRIDDLAQHVAFREQQEGRIDDANRQRYMVFEAAGDFQAAAAIQAENGGHCRMSDHLWNDETQLQQLFRQHWRRILREREQEVARLRQGWVAERESEMARARVEEWRNEQGEIDPGTYEAMASSGSEDHQERCQCSGCCVANGPENDSRGEWQNLRRTRPSNEEVGLFSVLRG